MSADILSSPPLPPADKVRVINRSVRCFRFGLVGVVPCFGLGTVWLAFKLFRDIAAETGEPVKLYPLYLTSVAGVCLGAACGAHDLASGVLADAVLLLVLPFLFLRRQYLRNTPVEWNPARHLMYLGLGLANLGSILSAATVLLVMAEANQW
jgi:hypothetical protein